MRTNGRDRRGQTLIEVVMATMIAAMTTTAIFSVILSSFVADSKADKREAASMALKYAQEVLKSYVSAVPTEAAYTAGTAGGHWSADSSGANRWALAAGAPDHNLDVLVMTTALNVPGQPGPTLRYRVADSNCITSLVPAAPENSCKTVTFTLTYPDSQ